MYCNIIVHTEIHGMATLHHCSKDFNKVPSVVGMRVQLLFNNGSIETDCPKSRSRCIRSILKKATDDLVGEQTNLIYYVECNLKFENGYTIRTVVNNQKEKTLKANMDHTA